MKRVILRYPWIQLWRIWPSSKGETQSWAMIRRDHSRRSLFMREGLSKKWGAKKLILRFLVIKIWLCLLDRMTSLKFMLQKILMGQIALYNQTNILTAKWVAATNLTSTKRHSSSTRVRPILSTLRIWWVILILRKETKRPESLCDHGRCNRSLKGHPKNQEKASLKFTKIAMTTNLTNLLNLRSPKWNRKEEPISQRPNLKRTRRSSEMTSSI